MQRQFLQINNVSFKYPGSAEPVFSNVNAQFEKGWTGVVGANGSGKTTFLKLLAGLFKPTAGSLNSAGINYYCEQRTDKRPGGLIDFINSYDKYSFKLKDLLGIEDDWYQRWETLSHGERKRAQIGTAMFIKPDILVIDEPTNHIDIRTKQRLVNSLKAYTGIGVIVSHDRNLLDELCHHIMMIDRTGLITRKGNYTIFEEEMKRENEFLINRKEIINKEIKKLETEVKKRKQKASQADSKKSKKNISKHDHDAKSKMDFARLTGKDATDGKIYNRLKSRMERMDDDLKSIKNVNTRKLGIKIDSDDMEKSVLLFYRKEEIKLGSHKRLIVPDLYIRRGSRIGLTGENGSGKSTLLNKILSSLEKTNISVLYIRQEITSNESARVLEEVKNYRNEDKGMIFTIIDRLGSDPQRLLDSAVPSPGEVRKLILAKGLLDSSQLIIMDEPTNHMDLPSIKCVEDALQKYGGSLLLVSHDYLFLNNVANTFWTTEKEDELIFNLKIV